MKILKHVFIGLFTMALGFGVFYAIGAAVDFLLDKHPTYPAFVTALDGFVAAFAGGAFFASAYFLGEWVMSSHWRVVAKSEQEVPPC